MTTKADTLPLSRAPTRSASSSCNNATDNDGLEHVSPIPWYRDREYFLGGWSSATVWKSALIEAVGTGAMIVVSGQIGATLLGYRTPQLGAYIGISNIFLLSIFIYATMPASGGHLNPFITLSAMLVGICPVSRATLYILAQTIGAAAAGGLLYGIWGPTRSLQLQGGGCFYDTTKVTSGQVFLNEICGSFALLFLAFGVGLDPRQAEHFGPHVAPLLVGVALGLVSFASSGMIAGYTGAQMNPARCFAFGIARRDLSDQWIWWFGPLIAVLFLAVLYHFVPPHHAAKEHKRDETKRLAGSGGRGDA